MDTWRHGRGRLWGAVSVCNAVLATMAVLVICAVSSQAADLFVPSRATSSFFFPANTYWKDGACTVFFTRFIPTTSGRMDFLVVSASEGPTFNLPRGLMVAIHAAGTSCPYDLTECLGAHMFSQRYDKSELMTMAVGTSTWEAPIAGVNITKYKPEGIELVAGTTYFIGVQQTGAANGATPSAQPYFQSVSTWQPVHALKLQNSLLYTTTSGSLTCPVTAFPAPSPEPYNINGSRYFINASPSPVGTPIINTKGIAVGVCSIDGPSPTSCAQALFPTPASPTKTTTGSVSPTRTASRSVSPSVSPSFSASPSGTSSYTSSPTVTPTVTGTPTNTGTATITATASRTQTSTESPAATSSPSASVLPHVEVAVGVMAPAGIADPCSFYSEEQVMAITIALKCDFAKVAGVSASNVLLENFNATGCDHIELNNSERLTISMLSDADCALIRSNPAEAEDAVQHGGHISGEQVRRRRALAPGSQPQALFSAVYGLYITSQSPVVGQVLQGQDVVSFVSNLIASALQNGAGMSFSQGLWASASNVSVANLPSFFQVESVSGFSSVSGAAPNNDNNDLLVVLLSVLVPTVVLITIGAAWVLTSKSRMNRGRTVQPKDMVLSTMTTNEGQAQAPTAASVTGNEEALSGFHAAPVRPFGHSQKVAADEPFRASKALARHH